MSRLSTVFRLVLAISLLLAGLPAHACDEASEAADPVSVESPATSEHDRCPHHAAPAEPDPAEPLADTDPDCCGLFCHCGCSAPVPALTVLAPAGAVAENGQACASPTVLAPSLALDELLRPPKSLS